MTVRQLVHRIVNDLEESKLDLARQALEEIRGDPFELSEAEEHVLLAREAECDAGEKVSARGFLSQLREGSADSQG